MSRAWIGVMLVLALLGGCAAPLAPRETAAPGAALYTFVVLGPDGAAVARAITSDAECPTIEFDGVARAMSVRARPGTIAQRPTASSPAASKPSAFPVLTCEAAIPAGAARVTVAGRLLPLPKYRHSESS